MSKSFAIVVFVLSSLFANVQTAAGKQRPNMHSKEIYCSTHPEANRCSR